MFSGNTRRFTTVGGSFLPSPIVGGRTSATTSSRNLNVQADINPSLASGGGFSASYSATGKSAFVGILDGFLPADLKIKNKIFRDIYHHDPVAGGAVDIYATMPFSNFYLTGLKDRDALDVYHKSLEKMRIKVVLPALSREYLVYGKFIGSTVFDAKENMFSAIMIQDVDFCQIINVPFAGMDPLINLTVDPKFKELLLNKNNDPRYNQIIKHMPKIIRENYNKGVIPLDPANTLYIPRRTTAADSTGTSYYERLLPIHLMEKAMIRGSIDQVQRRQRAIMHITVSGDGDEYVPTIENLEAIKDMFLAADADPTGAIIVTHSGIQPNEVRDAASFFRADELFEYFNSSKYKALGISEAMITGEANFNAMDATLSLFIEQIREYRSMITQELFYEKIFPAIAYANDFTKDKFTVTGSSHGMGHSSHIIDNDGFPYAICADERHGFNVRDKMIDTSTLAMPTVSWQKHLRPEGDTAFLELLSAAEQHGVPIPLAMFASASGVDLNSILSNLDQEKNLRKRVQKYKDMLKEFDDTQGGYATQASAANHLISTLSGSRLKPKNILTRQYDERYLPHNTDKMGRFKITSAKQRKRMYGKQLNTLIEVLKKNNEDIKAEARAKRKPR